MNLGGPELLIIVVPVIVILVVVFASRGSYGVPMEGESLLPGPAGPWTDTFALAVTRVPGTTYTFPSATTMVVSGTRRPGWVWIVVILAFPIGLLALMAKVTEIGTLVFTEQGDTTLVRFSGTFQPRTVDAINAQIPSA